MTAPAASPAGNNSHAHAAFGDAAGAALAAGHFTIVTALGPVFVLGLHCVYGTGGLLLFVGMLHVWFGGSPAGPGVKSNVHVVDGPLPI
jgi:hypothetical protein